MPLTYTRPDNGDLRFDDADGCVIWISIYEHSIIRVRRWSRGTPHPHMRRTWSLVGCPPEGHDRHNIDALNILTRSAYAVRESDDYLHIDTGGLSLKIALSRFCIEWAADAPFAADNLLIGYSMDQRTGAIAHTLKRSPDEHYYGFGEKSGLIDKHGRRLRMHNTDAFGYDAQTSDPLYKHIPFYITLRDAPDGRSLAYGLFYDTPYDCEFDMGAEIDGYYGPYRVFRAAGGDLDYYLLYGPTIEQVIEKYTTLTGRIPLPPRWSLGYLGSAMRYTDSPTAQQALAEFVAKCQQHEIPCDGFHLSSGYKMAADGRRYVFTWNRDRIPDPAAMVDTFHSARMHVAANIKPALLTTHPRYAEAEPLFIRASNADQPDLTPFWGSLAAHLDFTHPDTIGWWKENIKQHLLAYGIDSTWNDNNEYNIRDDEARCNGFGSDTPIAALKPIQTLLMVLASQQAQQEAAPHQRAWQLTRAAAAGTQRYATVWTGDNNSLWHDLRYSIPLGMGLSLSGFANMGHDVGGFAGDPPEPELFLRWIQSGIFYPRFCIHSWRSDDHENAPWMYPEILPLVRGAINFRYQLMPYLYSLLWEASQTGHPVIRPTVYHFQDDPECHTQSFEFMLGPSLLIANVLDCGARSREVYLPRGVGWYDWHTGEFYEGGQTITLAAPLEHSPLLAREGSLIPTEVDGMRRVYAFPHRAAGEAAFRLYEDDGETLAYQRGEYQLIDLHMITSPEAVSVSASAEVEWVFPSTEQRPIQFQ